MVSLASKPASPSIVPTSSLKRKRSGSRPSESPVKKARVSFDDNLDIHVYNDGDKSLELVEEEVGRALQQQNAAGEKDVYYQIRHLLTKNPHSHDAPLTDYLHKYIIALNKNVTLLDHSRRSLVHSIIDCHWIARSDYFVDSYRMLLSSILSIHPGFSASALQMLVKMFVELPSPHLHQQDDSPIKREQIQERVHDTLKYILRRSPMASTYLQSLLSSTFPFATEPAKVHLRYVDNILRLSEYCPELKGWILSLALDKLVKLDVQIQVDIEELEDDLEERLVEGRVYDEEEDDDDSDGSVSSSEESLDPEEVRLKELRDSVTKLDSMMDLLFGHYESVFARSDVLESEKMYTSLLTQFVNIILPTYRSRHTQFILFHFSQISADFTSKFVGCCTHVAIDVNKPHLLRVAAAAYLASFIARGAHVSDYHVRDVFDLLCYHMEALRKSHEIGCRGPDLRRYGTYYAIVQALIYIFCFRWRSLIVTSDGRPPSDADIVYHEGDFSWHNATQDLLRRNIFSKLNPLKICAPSIVMQFARMAHHLRLVYVFPLLETNKRIRLARSVGGPAYLDGIGGRETALSFKKGDESFLLDAYFPFDPYLLPRSKRWLERDYVQWKPVPGMPVEKDEEEEEEEGEDDESGDDDDEEEEEVVEDHAQAEKNGDEPSKVDDAAHVAAASDEDEDEDEDEDSGSEDSE